MHIFDFSCADCGTVFEAFVRSELEQHQCPQCGSAAVTRQQVTQMSIRTGKTRRGRTIDLGSNSCPCRTHKHAHG